MIIQYIPSNRKYKKIAVVALEDGEKATVYDENYKAVVIGEQKVFDGKVRLHCNPCGKVVPLKECILWPRNKEAEQWIVHPHYISGRYTDENDTTEDGNIVMNITKEQETI